MSIYAHFHGHLTADPKTVSAGKKAKVCKFRIASNRRFRDGEGNLQERTDFIDIEAWEGAGEVIQKHFKKGSEIAGSGSLEYQDWEDKETQDKRSKHVIRLDHFDFCGGSRRGDEAEGAEEPAHASTTA